MVRTFTEEDLPKVMTLWLETNIAAHSFIPKEYWLQNFEAVENLIPQTEVYVCERFGKIHGFAGVNSGYIAGIFVSEAVQSKGVGTSLLARCMGIYDRLTLSVYEKNRRAVEFYLHRDFHAVKRQADKSTGETELFMEWRS